MKIGVVGAMDIEIFGVLEFMENKVCEVVRGLNFIKGNFNGNEMIVCYCNPGKVNSAAYCEALILRYEPDIVLNVGVVGGCGDLNIGDIVVPNKFIQYDIDVTELGEKIGYIFGLDVEEIKPDPNISENLIKAAEDEGFNVVEGGVGSADRFANPSVIENNKQQFETIIVDMESGPIAQVCQLASVPFGSLKCVSDNGLAEDQFEKYKVSSSNKAALVLKRYLEKI